VVGDEQPISNILSNIEHKLSQETISCLGNREQGIGKK
jgi:hypothetical protein